MKTLPPRYNKNAVCEIMDELANAVKDSVREEGISGGDVNYIFAVLI